MELTRFQKKALDYSKHISLTANAGSGKTFILSKRYVEIAFNEDIDLNNIVAITFTEKAASELYKRISKEIEDRYTDTSELNDRNRLKKIRRQLVSANISTIHSFCISILKEFPLEADVDANFTTIDPIMARELIDLSIADYTNKNINREDFKYLLRIFGNRNLLTQQLFYLIEKRKKIGALTETLYNKDQKEIQKFLKNQFDQFFEVLVNKNLSEFLESISVINDQVLSIKSDNENALEISFLVNQISKNQNVTEKFSQIKKISELGFTSKLEIRTKGYLHKDFHSELADKINNCVSYLEELKGFEIKEGREEREFELAKFGKIFTSIFIEISKVYENKKKINSYLDFEDILIKAKEILRIEDVRKRLGEKFRFIMIDEYQDTNEIQYEIFMPILDELRKGNLFVVGDEKQSIYKFRDADLELFNKTKNEIKKNSDQESLLILPHSFRLSPPISLFANKLFEKLFAEPNLEYNEVAASDLICASENKPGHIEFILSEDGVDEETELLVKKIKHEITKDKDLKYSDIAILCRKRTSFVRLEKYLSTQNIPFKIIAGKGFYQQQIIYDVYNYLSFLINPQDDKALVGLLRTPFFNISDTELIKINLCKGNTFWEKLSNRSCEESAIKRTVDSINKNLLLINKIDVGELIRKILTETSYWSVISYSKESQQDIANLNKLIQLANGFTNQSYKTVFDFVEYLKESINSFSDEGQAAVDEVDNSIQIMTIHQSKGLEFKTVFLYNCSDMNKQESVKAKTVAVDNKFGVLAKLPPKDNFFRKYESAPIVSAYEFIENKKEIAEVKRLLYVAVTRAVNKLFLTADISRRVNSKSFLGLIKLALNFDLSMDQIELSGILKIMETADTDIEKDLLIKIPFTKSIETIDDIEESNIIFNKEYKNYSLEILDYPKREIISASKVAVFTQCQLKYELTYEFGYSKLFVKFFNLINDLEYSAKEEDSVGGLGAVKGKIIHKLLENNISQEDLDKILPGYIEEEIDQFTVSEDEKQILSRNIISDLNGFYNSSSYKFISRLKEFQNEFEVYSKEGENYLYGIIDKLAFDNNKVFVIDYKTDDIDKNEIEERGNIYLPQLQFYAYLVAKLYTKIDLFEIRLIFIKHPEKNYVKVFRREEIKDFGKTISEFILSVKNKSYTKNLKHCHKCYFFLNKKMCIYDKVNK